jgi:hypothetical protein
MRDAVMQGTLEERILTICRQATEPLYTSEITDRLNREIGGKAAYTMSEIATRLQGLTAQMTQLTDGRWMLKR